MNQFPPSTWVREYTITAISNFFENSRRYSRLKVHHRCHWHRWQMEKIFKQKNFYNFVWTPLGSKFNIYIYIYIFAFKFTIRCLQPDIVPIICHRCQQHWLQNCRRCRWNRWQFATGVVDTGGKFATSVVVTDGSPWLANSSANVRKKFEITLRLFSGAWGKVIHEKTWSKKSRDTAILRHGGNLYW